MQLHVVSPGETLTAIAARYGVTVKALLADNGLSAEQTLVPGQCLVVLLPSVAHTVSAGETLFSIAVRYQTTVNQLLRNNPALRGMQTLQPGQTLTIRLSTERLGTLSVTGYAYTSIPPETLRPALPYLTWLSVFSYGITPTGDLIPAQDDTLLALAAEYGVGTILLLSALDGNGSFSSENASALFADPAAQDRLLQAIETTMRQKGYRGLELDFEYIYPSDAENYIAFVERATRRMQANGWFTVTALAPKNAADQKGLLYEAHDYPAIGRASDYLLLMTYEWGYGGGPPRAVAPLNEVERVVRYAQTAIDPAKLYMGVPNYGYDWPLPYVRGNRTYSIGNAVAVERAAEVGATIRFDQTAQSPFYRYRTAEGIEHEVWFEDARSYAAKLDLAARSRLYGVGIWNIMRPYQPLWSVCNALYTIRRAPL